MRLIINIIIVQCLVMSAFAQKGETLINRSPSLSPVPIEALFMKDAVNIQMTVNKRFSSQSKLGFFGVVNLLNTYDNNKDKNETMILTMASYELFEGFTINAGMWTNNVIGTRPSLALNYTIIGEDFLLINVPRIDLSEDHNIEHALIFEYFPRLTDTLILYSRVQGLYNYNVEEKAHDRSYIDLRLGVTYHKIRMGVGANLDFYGPKGIYKQNIGLFVGTMLF